jgi:hypothetical protein
METTRDDSVEQSTRSWPDVPKGVIDAENFARQAVEEWFRWVDALDDDHAWVAATGDGAVLFGPDCKGLLRRLDDLGVLPDNRVVRASGATLSNEIGVFTGSL